MNRQHPAKSGWIGLQVGKVCRGSVVSAAGMAFLMLSQASFAETTDSTTMLAQFDAVRDYCSQHYSGQAPQVHAFVGNLLSQAPQAQLDQIRSTSDHHTRTRQYVEGLEVSSSGAATCSTLAALGSSLSWPPRNK